MAISRRAVLVAFATGAGGYYLGTSQGGVDALADKLATTSDTVADATDPTKNLDGDLDRYEWSDDHTVLTVWFQSDNKSDFIALSHVDTDSLLYSTDAPEFQGPVEMPVGDLLACEQKEFPSADFELITGEGLVAGISVIEEINARQELTLPDETLAYAESADPSAVECNST